MSEDKIQPINKLHHIAEKIAPNLKKLGIVDVNNLLWYFPYRYDDLSEVKKINKLADGELVNIKIVVTKIKSYRSWRKKMIITDIVGTDGEDEIKAVWFGQKFVSKILKIGDEIFLSGKAQYKNSHWEMSNPGYEKAKDKLLHSARLVPIYHLTEKVSQKQLRFLMDRALQTATYSDDPLPADLLNKEAYPWLHEALQEIHFPSDEKKLQAATERLKFQELFYLQCKYQLAKNDYQKQTSEIIKSDIKLLSDFKKQLPFELTNDQKTALDDILADISQKKPMNRLLEGDVGSGKTIVALLAAAVAISKGKQVAFMAPTEILAQQHFNNAIKILPSNISKHIALFTKSFQKINSTETTKNKLSAEIELGSIKFIIGTHSLIQDKIKFDNLSLVIIDEQHRFGVNQRKTLKDKNKNKTVPHLLSMTATPIPRTLSLTLYGDLDISLITEKPGQRKPIKTFLVPEYKRADAYKFVYEKIKNNEQVFVICPLIDESDLQGVKSVTKEYQKLNDEIFPDVDIRMVHGKLKPAEKEKIMDDFKQNKFPILISTSVVEVGVDIPGATIMLIESAERFGLSQLHQFRGRIGRNDLDSYCMLFVTEPNKINTTRLKALTKSNDGFELAELDLELRGAGEIFGTKQTGLMNLKIAKLNDKKLIKKAQKWAKIIIKDKKYLSNTELQKTLKSLATEMHLE